jgi:hypothetical protein
MRNRDLARGAAIAGALLVAMPFLDHVFGGEGPAAVRAVVGSCGLALLALSAASYAGRTRT